MFTRPDISYTVNVCARYLSNPSKSDEIAVKRIMRYLKHRVKLGIEFGTGPVRELTAFVDSDWANSKKDRKSMTGYVIFHRGPIIAWASRRQKCVALSNTEAEWIALTEVAKDLMHCLQVLADADIAVTTATIKVDNQSALVVRDVRLHLIAPIETHRRPISLYTEERPIRTFRARLAATQKPGFVLQNRFSVKTGFSAA